MALSRATGISQNVPGLKVFSLEDNDLQKVIDEISENAISNFILPYSIAPNFLINGKVYFVPMVTEESSVVAAASAGAKFWADKGGFTSKVISSTKVGQVHFTWPGKYSQLREHIPFIQEALKERVKFSLRNMENRGGGIKKIEILDFTDKIPDYYQVKVLYDTAQAMGANLINSNLEEMANALQLYLQGNMQGDLSHCEIIMAILSNHTPDCLVECSVECEINQFGSIFGQITASDFVRKFELAVAIANADIYRATTHNKGIFNGIDAVLIATGNDFRAVEAGGHSYAASTGRYKSLTSIDVDGSLFKYTLRIPMSIGTVGGLTTVHPLAAASLDILGKPSVQGLMEIIAAVGLANNFSAIRALVTSGIQKGHMKFHLNNILNSLNAKGIEKEKALLFFKEEIVTFDAVKKFIEGLRNS